MEHVNAAKKGALPNMYKSCNGGKEEEPCSRNRVPELDKICEWEKRRLILSVQCSNWDCIGIIDMPHHSLLRLYMVFDLCKSIPAP